MNVQEMMKLADESSPELVADIAQTMVLTEEFGPEFLDDVIADFEAIAKNVDEKSKTAGWGKDFAKGVATTVGATVATGLGLAVATDLYNAARRGLTSGRNWKRMISANPQFREHDLGEVRKHFKTLHRVAPDVSSDPLAAGAIVSRLMNTAGDMMTYDKPILDALKLQKDTVDARYKLDAAKTVKIESGGGSRSSAFPTNPPRRA